eukprot:g5958.t1
MGLTWEGYFKHLMTMGAGLPLSAIKNNKVVNLDYSLRDLTGAEVHELSMVLKANKSLKTFELDWRNMREEHKLSLLASKHRAIVHNRQNFCFECENGNVNMVRAFAQGGICEKADAMVWACEKGNLEIVQALVEGHTVEGTWVTLDDFLNRKGKNSSGKKSARPIDAAVSVSTALQFDIVVYLAGKGAKGEAFAGRAMVRACESGDLDSVKALVKGHDVEKTGMSVDKMVSKEGTDGNGYSKTPLQIAAEKNVIDYLFGVLLRDSNSVDTLRSVYKKALPKGTPLVCACEKGRLDDVRMLVEGHDLEKTGMSVDEMVSKNGKDSGGYSFTPLQMAVRNEQLEIVQYIVKSCTTVDLIGQTNSNGASSLHYAAEHSKKNVQMLQCLIDNYNGKDIKDIINQKNDDGKTPLDNAYVFYSIEEEDISLLREYGGKANWYDKNGNKVGEGKGDLNILCKACREGDLKELKTLVDDGNGHLIGPSDCLRAAMENEQLDIAQYLVKSWKADGSGTPLVLACEKGELDLVKAMVKGHDVEKTGMSVDEMVSKEGKDSGGFSCTPLQTAVRNEQLEIVQYIVKSCTTVDIIGQTNWYGYSTLNYAAQCSEKNVQTLQFLIDNYNGDIKHIINQRDKDGDTALDWAYGSSTNSHIKKGLVALLRKYGGKANKYDKNGNYVGSDKGDLND